MKDFKQYLLEHVAGTASQSFFRDHLDTIQDFSEDSITVDFVEDMVDIGLSYLAANTMRTYVAIFKAAIRRARHDGYVFPISDEDITRYSFIRKEASEHVYITRRELDLLEAYTPSGKAETFTRAVFLVMAYTGCRISDYTLINESAFQDGELVFTSNKTKVSARMPLHPKVPEWADILLDFNYSIPTATSIVSRTSKIIFRKLKVNKMTSLFQRGREQRKPKYAFVSAHTARRSFATNLILDGYSIHQVSKMMGHTNTNQTDSYIEVMYDDQVEGNRDYLRPASTENKERETVVARMLRAEGLSNVDILNVINVMKSFGKL